MALNLQDAFGFPLGPQPLGFCALANRAIPSAVIHAVKWMAVFADGFLRIDVTERCRISLGIFGWCQRVEVLWIHACSIAARVIDHITSRYQATRQPKSKAMRLPIGPSEAHDPIAILVLRSSPQKAVAAGLALGSKAFKFLRRRIGRVCHMGYAGQSVISVAGA